MHTNPPHSAGHLHAEQQPSTALCRHFGLFYSSENAAASSRVAVGAERNAGEIAIGLSQASQVLVAQQTHVPHRDLGVLADLDLQLLW